MMNTIGEWVKNSKRKNERDGNMARNGVCKKFHDTEMFFNMQNLFVTIRSVSDNAAGNTLIEMRPIYWIRNRLKCYVNTTRGFHNGRLYDRILKRAESSRNALPLSSVFTETER